MLRLHDYAYNVNKPGYYLHQQRESHRAKLIASETSAADAKAAVENDTELYIDHLYDAYPATFSWFRQYELWLFEEHASLLRNITEIEESLAIMKERMEHSASSADDLDMDWGGRAAWIGKTLREYRARLAEFRGRYKILLEYEMFRRLRLREGDGRGRPRWDELMSRKEYIELGWRH